MDIGMDSLTNRFNCTPARLILIGWLIGSPLLAAGAVQAAGLTFGILGKSLDDENFVDTWRACATAAAVDGNECRQLSPAGPSHPRTQTLALMKALSSKKYSALSVSVVNSRLIRHSLGREASIPLITFDSNFEATEQYLSSAYVGPDNIRFGRDLAIIAKRFKPNGGSLCVMTVQQEPNLMQRLTGIRRELSGNNSFPEDRQLRGENGWFEVDRCLWNAADIQERALRQLDVTLKSIKPEVFITVGHWPILDPEAYREAVNAYQTDIINERIIMIGGVGKLTPERQALLDDHLLHGIVSINFPEMGRQTYEVMKSVVNGEKVPYYQYTPLTVVMAD